jgi:hypothetical protein
VTNFDHVIFVPVKKKGKKVYLENIGLEDEKSQAVKNR